MRDIWPLIEKVRETLARDAPDLLALFSTLSEEARFGREWMDDDLKALPGNAKILEIGGGIFLLSCQLSLEGYDVTSIEPSGAGFGEFRRLGEKVLETARRMGAEPHVLSAEAENFSGDNAFDYAFSVNVMEHVADFHAAIHRIAQALKPQGAYRFVCPNYLFPYEPHFNIPTFFSKNLTGRVFRRHISGDRRMEDPEGVWRSLNWITVPRVKRSASGDAALTLTFRKDTFARMLERAANDPVFAARRSGWMNALAATAQRLRLLGLARHIPAAAQPIMDCRIVRRA